LCWQLELLDGSVLFLQQQLLGILPQQFLAQFAFLAQRLAVEQFNAPFEFDESLEQFFGEQLVAQ